MAITWDRHQANIKRQQQSAQKLREALSKSLSTLAVDMAIQVSGCVEPVYVHANPEKLARVLRARGLQVVPVDNTGSYELRELRWNGREYK
jgi:flagellar biosynthesis/type III secretory pathway protein FliH